MLIDDIVISDKFEEAWDFYPSYLLHNGNKTPAVYLDTVLKFLYNKEEHRKELDRLNVDYQFRKQFDDYRSLWQFMKEDRKHLT